MNRRAAALLVVPGGKPASLAPFVMHHSRRERVPAGPVRPTGDYLDAIYRRRWWILGLMALALAAAWLVSWLLPRPSEGLAPLKVDHGVAAGGTPATADMDQVIAPHMRMLQS